MSKVWNIYSKNTPVSGTSKYVAENLEYHDIWMGEEYVSVTIVSPKSPNPNTAEPFFLEIGDFIIYRGRTYSIYNVPSALKQARVQTYGEAFKYENVKFSSRAMELTEIRFLDIVLGDNQLHYTSLPTFSAYCETVDDLVDRLQANADRIKDDYDYWFFITPSKQRTLQRIIKWDPTANNNKGAWVPDTERRAVAELLWNEYFSVDADVANEKTNVNIQVDKVSVWDGLSYVKQHFGLNFITNVNSYGRNVIIGASAKHTENTFTYGKGNGLHQIERIADSDQLVVTKLYAYGSDKNLPYHYYNDINIRPYLKVTGSYSSAPVGISVLLENIAYDGGAFTNMILDDGSIRWYTFTCKITNGSSSVICDGNAEMVRISDSQNCTVRLYLASTGSTAGMKFTPQDKIDAVKDIFNNTNPITGIDVIFLSDTDISKFPSDRHTALTDGMPDNMSVNCLMLPGFPVYALNDIVKCEYIEVENEQLVDETRFYVRNTPDDEYSQTPSFIIPGNHVFTFSEDRLRPWIKSPNAAELGIKEGDVHFTEESDDNGLQDVHPSIEGMTENDVFHNGSTARLDEIESADVITDNGVFAEGVTIQNFKVKLKNLGFDLRAAYANAGSSMQLCMKDGYCGGRNFNVKGVNSIIDNNGNITGWELNVERLHDESLELYFPYSDKAAHGQTPIANEPYQIRGEIRDGNNELVYAGDHFVLTDILIQDTNYIHAASVELFRKSCIWLAANDYTRFTYLPKIDEIFMARDKDTAYRAEYDTIKAGNLMKFEDEDLQINGSVYIDQMTIKEGGNKDIPTFDVTLREDKQVGSLQRMQNQINSLTFAAGDSGGAALRYLKSIWDFDANGNLFTKYNVYSLLGISALGYSKGGSGGGGATSLDDLVDVEIASPTDGQVLKYNAQTHKWINGNDEGVTSVLWSNILNKPTTIGGYGITDAYISNGVIHLGGVEITPLTSFTETDPTVPQWAKASTKPSYAFSEITGTATSSQIPSLDAAKVTTGIFSVSLIPDITISKITDFPSKWAWSDIDNKPTTLSGYSITDVTIADGVITLGTGNTITPVTSVAMTVPTGFVVTGSPITKTGTLALAYSAGYEGFTTTLKNKIDLLYSLFTREGSGTSADPYIIKANYGLYTEQFLSALGLNSQQGSSGALEDLVDVNISNPQNNEVLKYDSQSGKWVNGTDQGVTSLAWSQITGKPTTVSGYGITDAYINAGTIYIGGASITPLTSFTETDPTVPAWAKAASKPSYVFSEITGTASASQIPSLDASKITSGTFDSTRIPTASSSVKGGVIVGTGLVIASAVLGLATSGVTQGTYTKLTVDKYGRVTFGTTLVASDIPSLPISKISGLQSALDAKLDKAFFHNLFRAHKTQNSQDVVIDANGDLSDAESIEAMFGFWTEQYLSALGKNASGGGGGGATALSDLVDVEISSPANSQILTFNGTKWINTPAPSPYVLPKASINELGGIRIGFLASGKNYAVMLDSNGNAYVNVPWSDTVYTLPTASSSVKGGVKVGTTLAISNEVLNLASGIVTAGTYRSVTVDTYGRVTGGTNPTTLSGYGITDAKIVNGTITLGSNSITPLTSFTETDPTVPAWAKAATKPSYTLDEVGDGSTRKLANYLPLNGGTMNGVINWGVGKTQEILQFTTNDYWKSGLRYSWSDLTTIAIWCKQKDAAFVWNAGVDDEINGHGSTIYDFRIRREANTVVARIAGNIVFHSGNLTKVSQLTNDAGYVTSSGVTNVAMSVPNGFSVSGSPITSTGTFAISYASGYEGFTTALKNKIDLLYSLFTREGSGTASDPYIIKANYGLYTEQFLSALGLSNSQGGSGGDVYWATLQNYDGTHTIDNRYINLSSYATTAQLGNYLSLSGGTMRGPIVFSYSGSGSIGVDSFGIYIQTGTHWIRATESGCDYDGNTIATQTWVSQNYALKSDIPSLATLSWSGYSSGSYDGTEAKAISIPNNTNQLTNGAGFVTASIVNGYATETWVNTRLGNYLPLTGGTITSSTSGPQLQINTTYSYPDSYITFKHNWVSKAYFGYEHNLHTHMQNATGYAVIGIRDDGTPYYSPNNATTIYTIIHSGNISSQSVAHATNANGLVDGSSIMTSAYNKSGLTTTSWFAAWNGYELRAISPAATKTTLGLDNVNNTADSEKTVNNAHYLSTYEGSTWYETDYRIFAQWDDPYHVRLKTTRVTYDVRVSASDKLVTSRTLWGQSFDGTGNVSGAISGATTISASGDVSIGGTLGVTGATTLSSTLSVTGATTLSSTLGVAGLLTVNSGITLANGTSITHNSGGEIFIGNPDNMNYVKFVEDICGEGNGGQTWHIYLDGTANFHDLEASTIHASVGIYSDGYVSALGQNTSSDIRKKNISDYGAFVDINAIASAPAIHYTWKDKENLGVQVGSVAQYWQKVLPESVHADKEGYLSMQYDVIALLSAISVAKRVTEHERRIEQLERENALLRMEINELKAA